MGNTIEVVLREGLRGFVTDPPDSDFQRGFLASLLNVAEELGFQDPIVRQARRVLQASVTTPVAA